MMKYLFSVKDKRNAMLQKNILLSASLKVVGLCASLLIVPVTLDYLNSGVYGIWLTMSSILYWFAFFDIGLGNGMRNYLTEAISVKDYDRAKSIISTTFILLFFIAFCIGVVVAALLYTTDMNKLFNTFLISGDMLRETMLMASVFTLMMFVVKNIGMIFVAMQKYAINDLLLVSGNVLALLLIFFLTQYAEKGNFPLVVFIFTATPVAVFLMASVVVFFKYPMLRPSFGNVNYKLANKVVGKGFGFFLIQITSCIVIFGSSNLFIAQFCGPSDVTVYNIAFRYFHLLAVAYTIIISPLWNAYTDAYVKGDMEWIGRTFSRSLKIWLLTVVVGVVMLLFSNLFFRLWVGTSVVVPFSVSVGVLFFMCFFNLNNCVTYLLNGLNKIRVQIYTSVIFTALFLMVMFLGGDRLDIVAISVCMAVSYLCMSLVHLYQCKLLVNSKAKGVWNK